MPKKSKKKEASDEVVISLDQLAVPGAIILAGVIIAVAVFLTNKGGTDRVETGTPSDNVGQDTDTPPESDSEFASASVDIGDAPFLGQGDATVAIIDFSDYRCSYCKRHAEETLPSIVENYVDTGKIMYVYRDFPIFGDDIANAAKCVFHQEGLDAYKEFHSNAFNVEDDDDIYAFAAEAGVNESEFDSCFSSKEYQNEVDADYQAGQDAGVQGTPGFVIGTIENGQVTGVLVPGAYPFESFEDIIEGYL